MRFADVWEITKDISTEDAFGKAECMALYSLATCLPACSTIIEVGCEFGRSTSVLAQVARECGHRLICIDPFDSPDIACQWIRTMWSLNVDITLHLMESKDAQCYYYDLILVDGNHSKEGVRADCDRLVTLATPGSYACFHDYGPRSLPDVYPTVQEFMAHQNADSDPTQNRWVELPSVGVLGIWQFQDTTGRYH